MQPEPEVWVLCISSLLGWNTSWLAGLGHPEGVAQWLHLLSWKLGWGGGTAALECNPGIFLALPLSSTVNVP